MSATLTTATLNNIFPVYYIKESKVLDKRKKTKTVICPGCRSFLEVDISTTEWKCHLCGTEFKLSNPFRVWPW